MNRSKRYREIKATIEAKKYTLSEAIEKVKQLAKAKYDESVHIALKLNINPKKTDQLIRGISNLPHGTGKKKKILVLAKGEKEIEAQIAGADYTGFDEYIEKIKGGWADVDLKWLAMRLVKEVGELMEELEEGVDAHCIWEAADVGSRGRGREDWRKFRGS